MSPWTARLSSLPLRRRLALLIAGCAGLTALLCMLAFVATAWWQQQAQARDEADGVVRTLAYALQAPVAFQDSKGVADTLAVLRARPAVSDAWVHDAAGKLLGHAGGTLAEPPVGEGGLLQGHMVAHAPIVVDGAVAGDAVIVYRLTQLWASLVIALGAMALGSAAAFALSVAAAQRLARTITEPVTTLAQASESIAQSHDYGQRLPDAGGDEVGTAMRAFNDMLDEIQARGDALREANRVLEQRVAERTLALRSEKERAEQASIAKTRFLANMSHELRTPLNAVIGAAQLLGDGDGERADRWHLVEAIRGSGINLLGLIENILDLSRIESGALELGSEDFDLVDCAEAAATTAAVSARMKGLQTACIVDPGVEAWRHGDALRLRQVMLNLLGNAMKFTERGEVVLRLRPGVQPQAVRIEVADTGIGIPEASRERIFEPFRQADDGSARRYGGSGLGLAIAAQLVRAMGGAIDVASEPGRGSTFGFEIVLPASRLPGPRPPQLQQCVAYVEPHQPSAEALAALLARMGCVGRRVHDTAELRRWIDHLPAGLRPWLLVAVDGDDGQARLLDESAAWFAPGRVVGMTRHHTATLDRSQTELGLSFLLIKPLLRSSLSARLATSAGGHGYAPDTMPEDLATAATLARSPHVLVVEDDHINQTIVCSMLKQAGYRTSAAFDGASALRQIARQRFDLVLMDWQMPDMDGLEVTRRLRAGAAGRSGLRVPIVALTANAFAEDRLACLAAGMNDFLTKPVLAANLNATVGRWARSGEPNLDSVFDGTLTTW